MHTKKTLFIYLLKFGQREVVSLKKSRKYFQKILLIFSKKKFKVFIHKNRFKAASQIFLFF